LLHHHVLERHEGHGLAAALNAVQRGESQLDLCFRRDGDRQAHQVGELFQRQRLALAQKRPQVSQIG
ncbi:hypothetical protein, partial [Deinococcus sp.]|uniref:hypothetical protein n=1 Tax=Deinococcus sp. TaxID=47478 RepID=UPI00286DB40A